MLSVSSAEIRIGFGFDFIGYENGARFAKQPWSEEKATANENCFGQSIDQMTDSNIRSSASLS